MKIERVNTMTLHEALTSDQLERLIVEHVMAKCDDAAFLEAAKEGKKVTLQIERLTEGSPAYPVDKWRASVSITAWVDP